MGTLSAEQPPVLWQIGISHYAEKVRWTLAHKRVDHVRRSTPPGLHIPVALWLSRGGSVTFPVLQIDGRNIGDSTEAIAVLEALHPEPALYPADPEQRRRALELEDFFDEELGPHTRLLPFHELMGEPKLFGELAAEAVPGPLAKAKPVLGAYARAYTSVRWGARDEEAAAAARAGIVAALDRVEAEIGANGGDYLVGEDFTVADLTAASLFVPLVGPEGGPIPPEQPLPAAYEEFRDSLSGRPGYLWVKEMYRRHRTVN
jgi:glutathione S-transferase